MHFFDDNRNRDINKLKESLRLIEKQELIDYFADNLLPAGYDDIKVEQVKFSDTDYETYCIDEYEFSAIVKYEVKDQSLLSRPDFLKELERFEIEYNGYETLDDILEISNKNTRQTGNDKVYDISNVMNDNHEHIEFKPVKIVDFTDGILRVLFKGSFVADCYDSGY